MIASVEISVCLESHVLIFYYLNFIPIILK